MQQYSINNRGLPLVFMGDLLAHESSNQDSDRWTEFEIFYTEKNSFVLNVISVWADGTEKNRSFVCQDFFELFECLKHPKFQTLSFAAQRAYNTALDAAKEAGIVDGGIYEVDFTKHTQKHDERGIRDFDFSEEP